MSIEVNIEQAVSTQRVLAGTDNHNKDLFIAWSHVRSRSRSDLIRVHISPPHDNTHEINTWKWSIQTQCGWFGYIMLNIV